MPTKREIEVYKFDELDAKAKQKALDWWIRLEHENFDTDHITDIFKEVLQEKGLPTKDVCWSLSNSQGDGVAFSGKLDVEDYLVKNKLVTDFAGLKGVDVSIDIRRNRNCHWNSMTVDVETWGELTPAQEKLVEELTEYVGDECKDVSKQLEKLGYEEIEFMTSEEQAKEAILANDYDFDVNGKRI